jgi:3-oxo-5-alpha-steroid 4-dehydrogenase 1
MQLVSLPILFAAPAINIHPIIIVCGVAIWGIGFIFEALGDYQLTIFKNNPRNKGKLMTTGLWSLTRHPNYFGEATLWWGIALIAYFKTYSLLSFMGPLTIDFLLLYVSGIPLLEAKYKGRKDWESYTRRVPAFFPKLKVA